MRFKTKTSSYIFNGMLVIFSFKIMYLNACSIYGQD